VKKFLWLIIGVPVAILLIIFCVANRQFVTMRLDPFNAVDPAVAIELPLFVFIFLALLAGIVLGGIASWLAQGKYRRAARNEHVRADRNEAEAQAQKRRAEALASGNPVSLRAALPASAPDQRSV
jgi:uncharacterized integral membrane protein